MGGYKEDLVSPLHLDLDEGLILNSLDVTKCKECEVFSETHCNQQLASALAPFLPAHEPKSCVN